MTRAPMRVPPLNRSTRGSTHCTSVRFLLRWAAFGGNQVSNFRCALRLELLNCLLQNAVSIGDPFVLAQMFKPGFHEKSLDHPALVGGIFEYAPGIGTIAPALTSKLFERRQERLPIFWIDPIL